MSDLFYRAFEDRHRGSRTLIKTRLGAYLPFLLPLTSGGRAASALDLGCGRGEWLELLGEIGFAAKGVDLDAGMLAACSELGLDASIGDAVSSLRAQPDASLDLVSAFHLVEHIPFDAVQDLIGEALRALKPGGLLVMETPNPENLVVATSGFYMDPSHLRPIPPQLLDFVVGFGGFERHKVVRLQEPAQLHGKGPIELINVLDGVSPDYSVVAQKRAEPEPMALLDAAFATNYGIELASLAHRYDAQQEQRQQQIQGSMAALDQRLGLAERENRVLFAGLDQIRSESRLMREELQRMRQTEERALRTEQQLEQVRAAAAQQLEQTRAAAEAQEQHATWKLNVMTVRAEAAERKVDELYASTSWRITRPARAAVSLVRHPLQTLVRARRAPHWLRRQTVRMVKPLVLWSMRKVLNQRRLAGFILGVLAKHPGLKMRLRRFATHAAYNGDTAHAAPASETASNMTDLHELPPRAARLAADFKNAAARRND